MKISKLIKFYFFPSGLVVAWFFGHLMLLLLSIKCICRQIEHSQRESNGNQALVQSQGTSKPESAESIPHGEWDRLRKGSLLYKAIYSLLDLALRKYYLTLLVLSIFAMLEAQDFL